MPRALSGVAFAEALALACAVAVFSAAALEPPSSTAQPLRAGAFVAPAP